MGSSISPGINQSLGNLLSIEEIASGIILHTSFGKCRILIYNDNIIRVSATLEKEFEDFSYAVVAKPGNVSFDLQPHETQIILNTASCKIIITKNPVRICFQDLNGKTLNEDDSLGVAWIGEQVTSYKKLQHEERFIGLGEKTGPLNRKGSAYLNWNTDAYAYNKGTDPLYSSMPFYIGIHNDSVYGIYLDNTHKSFFNFGASNHRFSSFSADAGEMNYYFFAGNSVSEIITYYTQLTGRMELPPLWSIGYQQCRYSYYPDNEVYLLAQTFRTKDIPADAIVFDIHYMEKYKIFTWDQKHFTDPKKLIQTLKDQGFHTIVMCDPGIKVEPGYEPYEDGVKKDVFIKYPDGEIYQGQVWPGWCHFPDFTNPKVRSWWESKFKDYVALGIEGFWNDMNEIATWGNALPDNIEFDFEGNKTTARRGRNVYGFQMARSTYEGTKNLLNGKRPFNLTRSGFSGVQRYSAVWTGDNVAYDEHMLLGVRMVNSMGLTGVAFAGYDAGGFVGESNTKLYARWMSIAAFSPFFRGHSMINTRDSEPWTYGEEVEQICRNYIKFRYQLLPYIYSLFYDAAKTGMPVQRSLAIYQTYDARVYEYHNQFLLGPSILVAPAESNKELLKVFLPSGDWYDLYSGKLFQGNTEMIVECPIHKLPVFIKAGSVLPMQHAASHTGVKQEEFILHIYHGNESSDFLYYTDDGSTFQYQQGACITRTIKYLAEDNKVLLTEENGDYQIDFKTIKIVFHGMYPERITINSNSYELTHQTHSFFAPLEKYDPIHDPDSMGEEHVRFIIIPYISTQIEINW
jgi:alpha-glucosidase